jgi:hypothetical protein
MVCSCLLIVVEGPILGGPADFEFRVPYNIKVGALYFMVFYFCTSVLRPKMAVVVSYHPPSSSRFILLLF